MQKNAHLGDLEKCCRMRLCSLSWLSVQPRTSSPKFLKHWGSITVEWEMPGSRDSLQHCAPLRLSTSALLLFWRRRGWHVIWQTRRFRSHLCGRVPPFCIWLRCCTSPRSTSLKNVANCNQRAFANSSFKYSAPANSRI